MREVAAGIWLLKGYPFDALNVYLAEDLLIDAGTRWDRYRILRQLRGRKVSLMALTHCHPDHQGAAGAVCKRFGVPLACHEADVSAMEGREAMGPCNRILSLGHWAWSGPTHPVGRVLRDGDRVGSFRVIHTPGHTAGHVIYFRESDGVALIGDVLANIHFLTGKPGLRTPPPFFCIDAAQCRRSVRILADLRPSVLCFGHGPPLYDMSQLDELSRKLHRMDEATES